MADPTVYVVPGKDKDGAPLRLRHPSNMPAQIPPEGALVPLDSFTRRRIKDGDFVRVEPPKAAQAAHAEPVRSRRPADASE